MSLIIFFGLATLITLIGLTYTALVIRHHWQQSRLQAKAQAEDTSSPN